MKNYLLVMLLIILIINPLKAVDFPDIKGWKPTSEIMTYNPENLYEYINGAADQFLDYGFQLLKTRDFSKGDLTVTIDIYDMGSQINAFGMYQTERPTDTKGLSIGAEAIISPPYQCLLLKGSYYIKVNVFEGEIAESTGKSLLESIANAVPGMNQIPEVLALLPSKNKMKGSEGYTNVGYLGLTELTNCIHAKYADNNEKEFQYFIVLAAGKITKEFIWGKLSEKWKELEYKKYSILVKKVPYKGCIGVALTNEKIIGVTDCENEQEVIDRLEAVLAK